jgi:uncharacterized protein (DUF58 family)
MEMFFPCPEKINEMDTKGLHREERRMKRVLYWVFFLILWLFLCLPATLAQQATGPRMIIEEKFFNAHQVKEGEIIEHTFTIQNKGDQVLEIKKVNPG